MVEDPDEGRSLSVAVGIAVRVAERECVGERGPERIGDTARQLAHPDASSDLDASSDPDHGSHPESDPEEALREGRRTAGAPVVGPC